MRDVGAVYHAAEDHVQPRVGQHLFCEDDKGVMHIVFGYGSGDAVQVSRHYAQWALGPDYRDDMPFVCPGKAGPATRLASAATVAASAFVTFAP